jgi:hypothetical protein
MPNDRLLAAARDESEAALPAPPAPPALDLLAVKLRDL